MRCIAAHHRIPNSYAINPKMMLMKATIKKKIGFLIKIEVHPMVCCIVDEKKIVISNPNNIHINIAKKPIMILNMDLVRDNSLSICFDNSWDSLSLTSSCFFK